MIVAAGGYQVYKLEVKLCVFFSNPSESRGRTDVAIPFVRMQYFVPLSTHLKRLSCAATTDQSPVCYLLTSQHPPTGWFSDCTVSLTWQLGRRQTVSLSWHDCFYVIGSAVLFPATQSTAKISQVFDLFFHCNIPPLFFFNSAMLPCQGALARCFELPLIQKAVLQARTHES